MNPMVPATKCPIDLTVQILANKWTISIIRELMGGPKRPSDLERRLRGISAKTLSERLHDLQAWGLVLRQSHPEVPPRVEYSLTELGQELKGPLDALKNFGRLWQERMNAETYGNGTCDECPNGPVADECPATEDLSARKNFEAKAMKQEPEANLRIAT